MTENTRKKRFYLTFDGAPDPRGTDKILATLQKHDIKATFFMEGSRVDKDPEAARRVLTEGHAVGNHSYTHPDFATLSMKQREEEVSKAQAALERHLGITTKLLRPPFGKIDDAAIDHFESLGYTIVLWDYSIRDWEGPDAKSIAARVLDRLKADEATIVMHDFVEWNPEAIDLIVPQIKALGYEFCRK